MSSATGSERRRIFRRLPVAILLLAVLVTAQSPAQQEDSGRMPFKLVRAGNYFQRTDSTGAKTLVLQSDVLITHDQSTISCDLLEFFPDSGYIRCTDSVRVADTVRTLYSDTLYYYVDSAYYRAVGSLRWQSEDLHGSGDAGQYWRDTDIFRVTGNAFAADSTRELHSNSMEYDYNTEELLADGDVHFVDTESGSEATAAGASYDSENKLLVLRGRPVLTYFEESDTLREDPFRLTGDVVTAFSSDSLVASGRVRLWQDSLTVTSDSLFHDRSHNRSFFRGGPPQVEHPDYRLTSHMLDVYSRERELERIEAAGEGRGEFWSEQPDSVSADEAAKYISWIEGDSLNLFFSGGAMDSIYASGAARSYYNESAESGVNYVQGGVILLVFKDNQLDVVEVGEGGRGVYLPPDSGGAITVIPDSAGFKSNPDSIIPR